MKMTIEEGEKTLLLRAETQADLDFLLKMEGVHERGPWHDAAFGNMRYEELGFAHGDAGKHLVAHGTPKRVMALVRLNLDWLSYAEPKTPEQQLRANAAAHIGHSLLDGFELLRGNT